MACKCCKKGERTNEPSGRLSLLCRIWKILTCEGDGGDPCVVVPGHLIHKPDPCIYSQFLLMQLNQPVTWDNPDVRILLGGVEQYSYSLLAGTEYTVEITVRNSSREKPATGTSVVVNWIEFGAGATVRHPVATIPADVPVWPGTSIVTAKWRTPDTPGHYCIEVDLSHPNDGNPANNRGWNNTQVHAANSPVSRPIRIFNRYPAGCPPVVEDQGPPLRLQRAFLGWGVIGAVAALLLHHSMFHGLRPVWRETALMLSEYAFMTAIGLAVEWMAFWLKRRRWTQRGRNPRKDRVDCHLVHTTVDSYEFADAIGKAFQPGTVFTGQGPKWPAQVVPASFVFAPGEAYRDVELRIEAPDDPGPPANFNVNIWQGGSPAGGITLTVTRGGH